MAETKVTIEGEKITYEVEYLGHNLVVKYPNRLGGWTLEISDSLGQLVYTGLIKTDSPSLDPVQAMTLAKARAELVIPAATAQEEPTNG